MNLVSLGSMTLTFIIVAAPLGLVILAIAKISNHFTDQ